MTLAVTGKVIVVKDLDRDLPRDANGPTVLDRVALTKAEWAAPAPPGKDPGGSWAVADPVARRFFPVLSLSDTTFRSPEEVTAVRLSGTVKAVRDGVAHLAFEGRIAGVHHGTENEARKGQQCSSEARILGGLGTFDLRSGKMLSLTLVWDGSFRNSPPYHEPPSRFGAVVEWRSAPGAGPDVEKKP